MLLSLCISAEAQEFFNLTAAQVKIDSLLPVFTWQKTLGPLYADSVYTVSIEYPEFIEMSKADIRRYQDVSGVPLPELPVVTQHVGVARKQGILDVSLVPLAFRDGRYYKLVSFKLNVQATSKSSHRSSTRAGSGDERYAAHSVLKEGVWAKVRVSESGIYQLTDALLRKAWFL